MTKRERVASSFKAMANLVGFGAISPDEAWACATERRGYYIRNSGCPLLDDGIDYWTNVSLIPSYRLTQRARCGRPMHENGVTRITRYCSPMGHIRRVAN